MYRFLDTSSRTTPARLRAIFAPIVPVRESRGVDFPVSANGSILRSVPSGMKEKINDETAKLVNDQQLSRSHSNLEYAVATEDANRSFSR